MRSAIGLFAGLALTGFALMHPVLAGERTAETNFVLKCVGCHGYDGMGSADGGIPAFPDKVGAFVGTAEGRAYLMHVPGVIGSSLSDKEIAGVMNYIVDTYAGTSRPAHFQPFTAEEVTALKATPIGNVVKYRRTVSALLAAQGIEVAGYPWP